MPVEYVDGHRTGESEDLSPASPTGCQATPHFLLRKSRDWRGAPLLSN